LEVSGLLHTLTLYPQKKSPQCQLDRRLDALHIYYGRYGEEEILDPTGTRTPTPFVVQSVPSRNTECNFFLICVVGLWGTAAITGLLYQPRMIGECDCGEIGGMKTGRETDVLGENLL
jgi:hypothetical protein